MSSLVAGVAAGAVGGGLAVTVLAPLTAANNFLGSYFFGSGMILGERQMYQDDWIKIKKRLDAGESFLVILEEVMKPNTQAVMQMAEQTVIAVSDQWNKIVINYLTSLSDSLLELIGLKLSTESKSEMLKKLPGGLQTPFDPTNPSINPPSPTKKPSKIGKPSPEIEGTTFDVPLLTTEPFKGKLKTGKTAKSKPKYPLAIVKTYQQIIVTMQVKITAVKKWDGTKVFKKLDPALKSTMVKKIIKWKSQIEQLHAALISMEKSYPGIQ